MKKSLYLIAFLTVCCTPLSAQNEKVGFEFYLGALGSRLKGKAIPYEENTRFGGTVNLLANIPVNEFLTVKTGLGYATRGGKFATSTFGIPETFSVKNSHIEIPFLLSIGRAETINLIFGPQVSILTKSNIEGLNNHELGLKFGIGFNVNRFVIQALMYRGLSNMTSSSSYDLRNNYTSVSLGWILIKSRAEKENEIPHRTLD